MGLQSAVDNYRKLEKQKAEALKEKNAATVVLQKKVEASANDEQPRKYAYRFELKNNSGGGTYITDAPPEEAKRELITKFVGRELEFIVLIN